MLRPLSLCPLALGLLSAPASAQAVVHVDASATGAADGTSWQDAFPDLQSALALEGVEVWVAGGVYVPGTEVADAFVLKSGVALYGGFAGTETSRAQRNWGENPTVLSGDLQQDDVYGGGPWYSGWNINTPNARHVLDASGVDASAVLDGFTVQAGYASSASYPDGWGGGMFCVGGSPTVHNCTFYRNLAAFGHGGGMFVLDGSPTIRDSRFLQNYVHLGQGGGIRFQGACAPVVEDCDFVEQRVVGASPEASGGGISSWSTLPWTVRRCRFERNTATNFHSMGDLGPARGAGIDSFYDGLTVDACVFLDNWAHAGAGLFTWGETTVVNSVFAGNTVVSYPLSPVASAGDWGAGVASSSAGADTTTIVGCTFYGNSAGEAAGVGSAWNHHSLILDSVLWNNVATGEEVTTRGAQYKGSADVEHSCVMGMFDPVPGEDPLDPSDFPGTIDDDPLLADGPSGDLHLLPGSPCIDAGDNAAVPAWVWTDLDGQPRFQDDPATPDTGAGTAPIVDMGAFEAGPGEPGTAVCLGEAALCPCANPGAPGEGCANSTGVGAVLAASGSPSVAADDLVLRVSQARPGKNGVFLQGATAIATPFRDGVLCTGDPTERLEFTTLDGDGAVASTVSIVTEGSVSPGEVRWYQFWFRDGMGPCNTGSNLTGGYRVDWQ